MSQRHATIPVTGDQHEESSRRVGAFPRRPNDPRPYRLTTVQIERTLPHTRGRLSELPECAENGRLRNESISLPALATPRSCFIVKGSRAYVHMLLYALLSCHIL